jgi:hypothetical protein
MRDWYARGMKVFTPKTVIRLVFVCIAGQRRSERGMASAFFLCAQKKEGLPKLLLLL